MSRGPGRRSTDDTLRPEPEGGQDSIPSGVSIEVMELGACQHQHPARAQGSRALLSGATAPRLSFHLSGSQDLFNTQTSHGSSCRNQQ
jgi:hypothetical protein